METTKDILEHYGIKGMRWGVRRTLSELQGNKSPFSKTKDEKTPITITFKPGEKIVTSGGTKADTVDEAKQVAIARQKARASGTQALTNQEMQLVVSRMNLEQQFKKLNPREKTIVEKVIDQLIYGEAPKIALKGASVLLADKKNPRIAKGLLFADTIIQNRPAPKKQKKG
jgi:hypothetical protein